jgi:FAD/FMN-containing dehydrogenase
MGSQDTTALEEQFVWRGDPAYEETRGSMVWQERKPDRYPEAIVSAASVDDVVAAVTWAREHGRQVSARSGGHSWAGTSVREGALLLDVGGLDELTIDADGRRAVVGPGVKGERLDAELAAQGLFFPVGHCPSVGIAGFLLGGGYGWWSHHYGQACLNVEAIDVVTPDGVVIHASADHHQDYFWAARGSGPGFYGVVVRFHLRLHRRPPVVMDTMLVVPGDARAAVFDWAWEVRDRLDTRVELAVFSMNRPTGAGDDQLVLVIAGAALADSEDEAREMLAPIAACPLASLALAQEPPRPTSMAALFAAQDTINPPGARYAVDNMWTSAGAERLSVFVDDVLDSLPTAKSMLLWYHWPAGDLPTDAALSVHSDVWISVYAIYDDAAEDAAHQAWVTELLTRHQHLSDGTQCSDENFAARFFLPMSQESLDRLEQQRAHHDPTGVFPGFPRPTAPAV